MDFITDYTLENYILDLKWNDLPKDVKERSIMCAIDLFCALILGSRGEQYAVGKRIVDSIGLKGDIPLIGIKDVTTNLLGASIVYGHGSNSFDIDDGNRQICGHPGASFIGGVLSAALEKKITYRQFLSTLVACYETTIRWAIAMQHHYGYLHSTGTYGAFGTAVGMGKILRLTKEKLNTALSIADYHAPLTPVMRAVEYPSMNKDGVPFGSYVGCMAILEAINGETGKTHLLEMPEYRYLLEDLGRKYYINDLYFKPYTCCRWTHQPIRAILDLKKQYHFSHKDVEKVIVYTFSAAAKLSKIKPNDTDEAQYNIAYPIACSLVYNDVGYDQVKTSNVHQSDVVSVMDILDFVVDPDLESQFPGKRLAYVVVKLKEGVEYKSDIYEAAGEPDDPEVDLFWIQKKFRRITLPIISSDDQDKILDILSECNDLDVVDIAKEISRAILSPL